jgi:hypothetical protein
METAAGRPPRTWMASAPPVIEEPPEPPHRSPLAGWIASVLILLISVGIAEWILQSRGVIHLPLPEWLTF